MSSKIIAALALGFLLVGTLAKAEAPPTPNKVSPVTTIVGYLTSISAKEAAAPQAQRVCCQVSGSFGNLFILITEGHCLAVPGMPSDDSLCKN